MKATDLMVGDWVSYCGFYNKVIYIGQKVSMYNGKGTEFTTDPEYIRPIPLTEEILVKNGFEKTTDDWNRHIPLIIFESVGFPTISIHADMDMKHFWVHGTIDLTYVHQLQHLLRLCGVEKELTI